MSSWSIGGISAVTLGVTRMAESVAFYRALGFEVSYGGPAASFTTLRAGESVINLREEAAGRAEGLGGGCRVILRVRGVDALHRELVARGLAPTTPRDAEWGERYCEVTDPQGLVISFAELLE
jgi:catechol 2,3-dioxygenase-like lactoylglutathione lyase family enzyme